MPRLPLLVYLILSVLLSYAFCVAIECFSCASELMREHSNLLPHVAVFTEHCWDGYALHSNIPTVACRYACYTSRGPVPVYDQDGEIQFYYEGIVRGCWTTAFGLHTMAPGIPQQLICDNCTNVLDFNRCRVRFQALIATKFQPSGHDEICACFNNYCNAVITANSSRVSRNNWTAAFLCFLYALLS